MLAAEFDVTLTLTGPIMTQSSSAGAFGLDAVMAQSSGRYYLAGSLLKGLVHEAWQELSSADPSFLAPRKWLGSASPDDSDQQPDRGLLFFEDLQDTKTDPANSGTLFRIKIDSERGSVERGAYQVIESPYKPGQPVPFTGKIRLFAQNEAEVTEVRKAVLACLNWIQSAGAERTIGFGRNHQVVCGNPKFLRWPKKPAKAGQNHFKLTLAFERPICMARRRIAGNLFKSEDTISGATLKGSLAALIDQDPEAFPLLREHLWAIRFAHAFPDNKGIRAVRQPESIFTFDIGTPDPASKDALRMSTQELESFEHEIKFSVDWKPGKGFYTWPEVKKELRVRTAIKSEIRKAEEAKLFAYEVLVTKDRTWIGSATLPDVPGLSEEFQTALQHGLFGIGKTKAHAEAVPEPATPPPVQLTGDDVAITLQTPALICDPSRHLAANKENGTSDAAAMERAYREAWKDLSGDSLELLNYFHRCSLAGSEYVRRRFQKGHSYTPYLLTDAGSVFLFKIKDAAAAKAFLTKGLWLTDSVKRFYNLKGVPEKDLWQRCPYLPENGYGEIAIDLEVL